MRRSPGRRSRHGASLGNEHASALGVGCVGVAAFAFGRLRPRPRGPWRTPRGRRRRTTALQLVLPLRADDGGLRRFALPSRPRLASVCALRVSGRARASLRRHADRPRASVGYLRSHGATGVRIDATGLFAEATLKWTSPSGCSTPAGAHSARVTRGRVRRAGRRAERTAALQGLVPAWSGSTRGRCHGLAPVPHAHRWRAERRPDPGSLGCRAAVFVSTPRRALRRLPRGVGRGGGRRSDDGRLHTQPVLGRVRLQPAAGDWHPRSGRARGADRDRRLPARTSPPSPSASACATADHPVRRRRLARLPPGGEATLDLEILDAAAPGLKGIDVYETKSAPSARSQALTAPLQNPRRQAAGGLGVARAVRAGRVGGYRRRRHRRGRRLLELAAASGVSFLASTGDQGSADCTTPTACPSTSSPSTTPSSRTG